MNQEIKNKINELRNGQVVRKKEDYRNTVMLPPSLLFSYEKVKEVLFMLYPKAEFISFVESK